MMYDRWSLWYSYLFFDLVDVEGTEELSPIPLASTASFAGNFFWLFSLAGWLATFSVVLRRIALFAALFAEYSVAFDVIALTITWLDG